MDIDGKKAECDIDTSDYFKAISYFKHAHKNNFVLYISTL